MALHVPLEDANNYFPSEHATVSIEIKKFHALFECHSSSYFSGNLILEIPDEKRRVGPESTMLLQTITLFYTPETKKRSHFYSKSKK